jgi:hypothetical protein
MLILGGRYGSIEEESKKSYIQLEYEYAESKKKPFFAAVISDRFLEEKVKSVGASAIETMHGEKLAQFRTSVKSKICRFFNNDAELKLIVFESLADFAKGDSMIGWVRGNEVVNAKDTLEEITRLQQDNFHLKKDIDSLQSLLAEERGEKTLLGDDAKSLLLSAISGGAKIHYLRYMGGARIETGEKNFIEPENDARVEARWKAALEELVATGMIEDRGYKGEVFRVTHKGFTFAEVNLPKTSIEASTSK